MFEDPKKVAEAAGADVAVILVVEPKTRQLVDRLRTAFASHALGLEPHLTGFGEPDYYECPCCKSRMNVRGSAYERRAIDDPAMTHNPDCVLAELSQLVGSV